MSSASRTGGGSAAPSVMSWRDLERVVAAVVEQRQRLAERTDRRDRLSRRLSTALEAQKLRAEQEADAEGRILARASLMQRIHDEHREAASSRHAAQGVRDQIAFRRKDLHRAAECACSASARLQEAEELLEAHGERLARRLGAEVTSLRASAIADLDIVFPIRDLSGRRPPAHCREARAAGLEAASDARNGPGTPEPDRAHAPACATQGNGRGGPPNGVGVPHLPEQSRGTLETKAGVSASEEVRSADRTSSARGVGVFDPLATGDDEHRDGKATLEAEKLPSHPVSTLRDAGVQLPCGITSAQGQAGSRSNGQQEHSAGIPRAASQGGGGQGLRSLDAVVGTGSEQALGYEGPQPSARGRGLEEPGRGAGSGELAVCGLLLLSAQQLRRDGLASEAQRQQQAAALGMCAQIVELATKYGGLTLRYPVTWRASRSLVRDPHPPASARLGELLVDDESIDWPLFPEPHNNLSKCSLAMVLLAKDVAQILDSLGIQWVGDKHAILRNLAELISQPCLSGSGSNKMC